MRLMNSQDEPSLSEALRKLTITIGAGTPNQINSFKAKIKAVVDGLDTAHQTRFVRNLDALMGFVDQRGDAKEPVRRALAALDDVSSKIHWKGDHLVDSLQSFMDRLGDVNPTGGCVDPLASDLLKQFVELARKFGDITHRDVREQVWQLVHRQPQPALLQQKLGMFMAQLGGTREHTPYLQISNGDSRLFQLWSLMDHTFEQARKPMTTPEALKAFLDRSSAMKGLDEEGRESLRKALLPMYGAERGVSNPEASIEEILIGRSSAAAERLLQSAREDHVAAVGLEASEAGKSQIDQALNALGRKRSDVAMADDGHCFFHAINYARTLKPESAKISAAPGSSASGLLLTLRTPGSSASSLLLALWRSLKSIYP